MRRFVAVFAVVLLVAANASAAKLELTKGSTSVELEVFIQDSSSTTGAGLTGLVYNSAGLGCQYYLNSAASSTAITLATATLGTYTSGGFIVVDATNMPGTYSLHPPNAALTGAKSVVIFCDGATNMAPLVLEIQLTETDWDDNVQMGITALPAFAAGAAGGLPDDTDANGAVRIVDGTGARELDTASGAVASVTTATTCTTASTCTALGANAVDATAIATGAIDADAIAAAAITSSEAPNLDVAVSTRATPAEVNTQMVDVLKTDTSTLPGAAAPTATPTIEEMIEYLYKAWRNKKTQTETQYSLYDDTGASVEQKATVSDAAGTTTVEEIVSGP